MKIRIGNKAFYVKDCRGLSCARGLMFDHMQDIDGALVRGSSMWMPFVCHGLDLFFLDREMKILDIQESVPMTLNPKTWKSYACRDARYCLEMKKGMFKAKVGMKIKTVIRR